jgi:hypothetical protein
MELFDYLKGITEKKTPFDPKDDSVVKGYSPFLINRFVSMCEAYIMLVNEINKYPDITKETHYNFYMSALPQRKQYFKYIKKEKDLTEEEVGYVADYFDVTSREARSHIQVLDKETIKAIISKYQYGQSKIKEI